MGRHFRLDEANALLPEVGRLIREAVHSKGRYQEAETWLHDLAQRIMMSGGVNVDTARVAYETLVSLMVIVGFLPFVYVFGSAWIAGKRVSAISGWAVTLLAIVCSVIPPADTRAWVFEGKLALGTVAVIASAFWVFRRQSRQIHL